jgi:hypothetical protein
LDDLAIQSDEWDNLKPEGPQIAKIDIWNDWVLINEKVIQFPIKNEWHSTRNETPHLNFNCLCHNMSGDLTASLHKYLGLPRGGSPSINAILSPSSSRTMPFHLIPIIGQELDFGFQGKKFRPYSASVLAAFLLS